MFNWIQQFLTERSFKVKVWNEESESYNIECGVPLGSVISPILFIIMINNICNGIDLGIGAALYADDGTLWKYIQTNYFHIYRRIKGTRIWGDRYRNIYSRIRNKHIQKIIK